MKALAIHANPIVLAWYKQPGLVYFLKAGDVIKIAVAAVSKGKTLKDAVRRRMRQIQSANHELVELEATMHHSTPRKTRKSGAKREPKAYR